MPQVKTCPACDGLGYVATHDPARVAVCPQCLSPGVPASLSEAVYPVRPLTFVLAHYPGYVRAFIVPALWDKAMFPGNPFHAEPCTQEQAESEVTSPVRLADLASGSAFYLPRISRHVFVALAPCQFQLLDDDDSGPWSLDPLTPAIQVIT